MYEAYLKVQPNVLHPLRSFPIYTSEEIYLKLFSDRLLYFKGRLQPLTI